MVNDKVNAMVNVMVIYINEDLRHRSQEQLLFSLHNLDQSDLLNKQAIVMSGYQHYLYPIMGDTFISSFVLPSVPSFLMLAS
jgi:hypothetical protein